MKSILPVNVKLVTCPNCKQNVPPAPAGCIKCGLKGRRWNLFLYANTDSDPRWDSAEGRKILNLMAGHPAEPANPRHSSKKSDWGTPQWILAPARKVLDGIDLDPASSAKANKFVEAATYCTKRDNGLKQRWCGLRRPSSVWLNPPGGLMDRNGRAVMAKCRELGSCGLAPGHIHKDVESSVKLWWRKLMSERNQKYFGHALFLSFSIEAMQVTQVDCGQSLLEFPTVVFKNRVNYVDASGQEVGGNTHSSCITYVSGRRDVTAYFLDCFQAFGKAVVPARLMR